MNRTKKRDVLTSKQVDALIGWCFNLITTYHIDYFRGDALLYAMQAISKRTLGNIDRAKVGIHRALYYRFEANTKDYDNLLKELQKIEKEVPLDVKAKTAIKRILGGDWVEAIKALNNLDVKRNEQN